MHVHLIGVAGTGMGTLAGLLVRDGHHVTGSDTAFYPPMGDQLRALGIETREGFAAEHLIPRPDLVVIGNVCRSNNVEARAAIDGGIPYASMAKVIGERFLEGRTPLVIAGTHGKTTTTALLSFLLDRVHLAPGFFVGGVMRDFDSSARAARPGAPFVIEGDEYDSAFFEKTPKFWQYRPHGVLLTSVEHDHIDIYPTFDRYRDAFAELIARIPESGHLVAWAGSAVVRELAKEARCAVHFYALDGDETGDVTPTWFGALSEATADSQPFDLFYGGSSSGRVLSPLPGRHNALNTVGAIALAVESLRAPLQSLTRALPGFRGIARRQDVVAVADGVTIYDDFAHHPTAVRETIAAIRARHAGKRIVAIFEPRSATASRNLHQQDYVDAFAGADLSLIAPVGRSEIPSAERLDVEVLVGAIRRRGARAESPKSVDSIVELAVRDARPGDVVLVMSNGAFGGIHDKLAIGFASRRMRSRLDTARA